VRNAARYGLAGILLACLCGCQSFNPLAHRNVAALSDQQQKYFTSLSATLKAHKDSFHRSMVDSASTDFQRRRRILDWQRDLVKVDLLLQVPGDAAQKEELLFTKLAELDLDSSQRLISAQSIDADRVAAVDNLYATLIEATDKLLENNKQITQYLSAPDSTFVVESIDVAAIVRVASAVRDLENQLRELKARSDDQRKKDDATLEKQLDTVQATLVKALTSNAIK
jgi:hypothetical protein